MSPSLEQFLALEAGVWEALKRGDAAADAKLLSEDFLGVYETGFADRNAHCGELKHGPTVSSYEISRARILPLSEDTVLLSYLADWTRIKDGAAGAPEKMFVTSIWQRRGAGWLNIFSQDTHCKKNR